MIVINCEKVVCRILEFVKAISFVRCIVTKSWTVKQLSKFLTGRCGLIWNPLDIRFFSAGNEWKKCFHWTVNLLVPARNLRFNWTWSCSETRKRERSREREEQRGCPTQDSCEGSSAPNISDTPCHYSCGETTWPLQGTWAARLWTSLMWCKNCRVSVTL